MKQAAGKGMLFLAMVLLALVPARAPLADSQDTPDLRGGVEGVNLK